MDEQKTPARTDETPGISVVGTGYWGRNLVRNYAALGALQGVCDRDAAVLSQIAGHYPGIQTCLAMTECLANPAVAGVVIATPAETHFPLAREALLAGKHVYVEKPLVLAEPEGKELIRIAAEKKRILMVGHLLHYHPAFQRLQRLCAGGELGRINYIYSHRLNLGKIRREENTLWSFAPHDISMILALAGADPEEVIATGGNYLHERIADVTTTHLSFASGLRAHIFVSWLHPFKEQKLVVVGDRKMAVFDDTRPWPDKLLLYPHAIRWENHVPVPVKAAPEKVDVPEEEPLRAECLQFLRSMATGEPPATDGTEGLRVLRVLRAAQRSLEQRGLATPVPAPGPFAAAPDGPAPAAPSLFFAHPTAVLDANVTIGRGAKIWHFSHILSGSVVGEGCNIGQNVVIGPDVALGSRCKIQNNVSVYKGVTLENGVFCGPSMVFTNILNPRAEIAKMDQVRPTLVRRGATLGANCTIVCGHTIGAYAFVGAGAVVTRDVPDHALVAGNPARRIGWACVCGERLDAGLSCGACGRTFEPRRGGGLTLRS